MEVKVRFSLANIRQSCALGGFKCFLLFHCKTSEIAIEFSRVTFACIRLRIH